VEASAFVTYLIKDINGFLTKRGDNKTRLFVADNESDPNSAQSFQRQLGSHFRYLNEYIEGYPINGEDGLSNKRVQYSCPSGKRSTPIVDYVENILQRKFVTIDQVIQEDKLGPHHLAKIKEMKKLLIENQPPVINAEDGGPSHRALCRELCKHNIFRTSLGGRVYVPHSTLAQTIIKTRDFKEKQSQNKPTVPTD